MRRKEVGHNMFCPLILGGTSYKSTFCIYGEQRHKRQQHRRMVHELREQATAIEGNANRKDKAGFRDKREGLFQFDCFEGADEQMEI